MFIGKRIKELRESKKMTLSELSKASGVQIATLSRIENMKMPGTIDSHSRIAKALSVDITELYKNISEPEPKGEPLGVSSATESFSYNDKASYEILASKVLSKKMLPIVLRIDPGGKTNPEENAKGSEKFIFVLEGEVTTHIGEDAYPLSKNKTLYFDASLRHYFENAGKGVAKMIAVVTPVAL